MRRVLMICYYYPPIRSVGAIRSVEFSKLLPEFGWTPSVLSVSKAQEKWLASGTTAPPGVEVDYSPELPFPGLLDFLHGVSVRLFRLFGVEITRNYFREYLAIPDSQIFWLFGIKGYKLSTAVDAIYVSCGPHSPAIVASVISKFSGKPLVLDYRDTWSFNPYLKRSGFTFWVTNILEKFVLKQATKVILNTAGALKHYQTHFPEFYAKMTCIPNGYDSIPELQPAQSERFIILHLGSFYTSRRPDLLLQAIRQLPELKIQFIQVGGSFESYPQFAEMQNLTVIESVKREETQRYLEQASLLYLKQGWEDGVTDYIMVAAKTYEYIAAGLPILAEAPPGDNIEMVRKYAAKSYLVTTPDDLESMKTQLRAAYADWEQAKNSSEPFKNKINPEFLEKFDRRNLTRELAKVLESSLVQK